MTDRPIGEGYVAVVITYHRLALIGNRRYVVKWLTSQEPFGLCQGSGEENHMTEAKKHELQKEYTAQVL
jgi:hypothetical protein